MKARVEHRVPLSPRRMEILKDTKEVSCGSPCIFPGRSAEHPMSNMVFEITLRDRMGRDDITVHGFRSSFKTLAEETTAFPNLVIEAALAHTLKNKVEAAYLRTTFFEKRREQMNAWAKSATAKPKRKRA